MPILQHIERDHLLAPHTTWKIGGPAAFYCEPVNVTELEACLVFAGQQELPVLFLGGASNMLVADEGFSGLVVRYMDRTEDLTEDTSSETCSLRLGSRTLLSSVSRRYTRLGWGGLEWAEGIPGTLGGAVVGNAGAYGGEIAAIVLGVETFSLTEGLRSWPQEDCGFAYRTSEFKTRPSLAASTIVSVTLALRSEDPQLLQTRMKEISTSRKARSPVGMSCGSVFKNPPGHHVGQLVEAAGLRGTRIGDAQISEKHGNYIINLGQATASDILELMALMAETIHRKHGIKLVSEIRKVGFPATDKGIISQVPPPPRR